METEAVDKLFLELSQFTQARTKRELELESQIEKLGSQKKLSAALDDLRTILHKETQNADIDLVTNMLMKFLSSDIAKSAVYDWIDDNK